MMALIPQVDNLGWHIRQKQRDNQEDLLSRVNAETRRMLQKRQDGADPGSGQGRKVSDTCAYSSVADMPAPRDLAIQVQLLCHAF